MSIEQRFAEVVASPLPRAYHQSPGWQTLFSDLVLLMVNIRLRNEARAHGIQVRVERQWANRFQRA
jgi:hypothetical protein